jgi:hypothetical protein
MPFLVTLVIGKKSLHEDISDILDVTLTERFDGD